MTVTLTSGQEADLRKGLGAWEGSYTIEELNKIAGYLSSGAKVYIELHRAVLGWCFEELLAIEGKVHDFSFAEVEGSANQKWKHLERLVAIYADDLARVRARVSDDSGAGVVTAARGKVRHSIRREYPDGRRYERI